MWKTATASKKVIVMRHFEITAAHWNNSSPHFEITFAPLWNNYLGPTLK